ncbi:flagellin [Exiguobacterium sp. s50]|uniref:flagellin N-terminal helical domain-containing protein n=1 Tax=Exiguobacterium sp. s50 TaxID=2751234 RepID=UPI001BEC490D|nr:flagellin [Exiguobacterium sp. s50]
MIINHNLNSMNAHRNMSINTTQTGKAMEKLSSGLRINRAGDDAAGLAISEKMRGQIRGLDQASRNAQDGISLIQTAEGALNETHSMLQRVRELVVQADNGTNTTADRDAIQKEIGELSNEITDTAEKTKFNTLSLINGSAGVQVSGGTAIAGLVTAAGAKIDVSNADPSSTYTLSRTLNDITLTNGSVSQTISVANAAAVATGTELNFDSLGVKLTTGSVTDFSQAANVGTITTGASAALKFQIGANNTANEAINLSIGNMRADSLGNAVAGQKVSDINVTSTTQTYNTRIDILDKAIATVSTERANLGSKQNRLEHTINNLGTTSENLTAAESRVRDVDMAKEMMNFTKNNILNQAAQAMMSQSNQQPQAVLQLLR